MDTFGEPAAALYPPHVEPSTGEVPIWSVLRLLVSNPLRVVPDRVYREPIVTVQRLGLDIAFITDPALIMTVLLGEAETYEKSEFEKRILGPNVANGILSAKGAAWRWQRTIGAPLFRPAQTLANVPQMAASAMACVERWRAAIKSPGQLHDIEPDMKDVSFDVVSTTVMAGFNADETATFKQTENINARYMLWDIAAAFVSLPESVWFPYKNTMKTANANMRAAMLRLIARRRRELSDQPAEDILGRLIAARHPATGATLTDDQVCDNVAAYLDAGHESSSAAMTWASYLLARSPSWQERVRAEVAAVAGDGPIEARHIEQLVVTTRVVKETLRLYPSFPAMVRVATKATMLGGAPLAKGTLVFVLIYATHRHTKLWDDPGRFDPDRFTPDKEALMPRGQYLPFSAGQRICLGMNFALAELVTAVATFVRAARFEWGGDEIEPVSQINLRPRNGMPLRVTLR